MARCPSVRLSVCHKPALYETAEWIELVFGTEATLTYPTLRLREFGYLQK